ncbi:MAG TPA: tRNA (N(6)-L-threonylcarbamoyladenosine(37)-C(2))-methylthiotransferase MtaB [Rhizobiales bacterium]|jgi:threonylcarbamoyladenosine tRNA methylthiotransferase MtaB|nr:tRNA (N(6)-L-threonylcarbamoyladenosine(37)-C(2))-methylthiotransferase MtaB [Hyphomicrobiales bacterium]HBH41106.1 tRNA (N(6)-L-threonylcarbamoyladenosine(37)-C(2))-methylthiotransferase MtaB [Hyphomicrobiales bacterium]HBR25740.1 tRNA (N(6)-L-threonylcarbamoyladenosine(37)-C(2))-methylthiotransferase MtaB [Hyphomicrobiales bacterium]HCL62945.1 tRNA (N(6)-L-threonylcarbamoyladenosine(37)-C(2))-methylthiotransferase MtaB [Hyphomicrobiales bacterium]
MSDIEIITFGCRLNAYESEVMRQHANATGLSDAVIVNTCAVTAEAVRQARQAIRKVRRERPDAKIVVTGCAAQIDPARFAAMDEVDHVIGNQEKLEAKSFAGLSIEGTERVAVNDIMSVRETAGHLIEGFGNHARAYVQIQNGCDHRCTFCVIPFGRGPSRSVPAGEVVAQVRRLAENGYAEIVLTGVDITAYGADLPGAITLGKLVRKVLALVPELPRLRLSSIDSIEADPVLLAAIAEEERLMPHLHLSLQSGDDLTLKRMKRRHARADSITFCEAVRRMRPDVVFGADLIAGFPTETEAMFRNSLSLVDDCGLTFLHVFPYSAREGTPAARMPQVHGATIARRAGELRDKGVAALKTHLAGAKGRRIQVLMENCGHGRSADFTPVRLDAEESAGALVEAIVSGDDGAALLAVVSP